MLITPKTWPQLLAKIVPAVVLCAAITYYVIQRIRVGRKAGKSWAAIASNGSKPVTGNVWLDASLFGGLIIVAFATFAYFLSQMAS